MTNTKKYVLGEDRIPKAWYNIAADLPAPLPAVLNPGTGQPIGPNDLAPLFPMAIIMQEVAASFFDLTLRSHRNQNPEGGYRSKRRLALQELRKARV